MNKPDIVEATPLIERLLANLSAIISDKGAAGIAASVAIGQTAVDAAYLCRTDGIGAALDNCFNLVRQTGPSLQQMGTVRILLMTETPLTLGALLVRNMAIFLAFAQQAVIISQMVFRSRQDVDALITVMQKPFAEVEELAADTMDNVAYRAIVELHAAVVNHLVQTARPLPEMLAYQFADPLPTLVISQRLYGDASRYDEIRAENKIVHPAFCPLNGEALSA
jgi:prophage DNA circulation protein